MTSDSKTIELSENHRRPIAAMLRQIDSACAAIENWLIRSSGPLLRLDDNLTPEQVERLHTLMEKVRASVRSAAREFGLPSQRQSRRAAVVALLSVNCADLEDTMSYNLKGYGKLTEETARRIDVRISGLLNLLGEMLAIVEHPKPET
ncbi:MAG TPA: hypothetical protein VNL38_03940 [Candidatus Nitrosotenuis sp.]|nr:hypothetical protein [Candidatus Nitrosotenuis sp.]